MAALAAAALLGAIAASAPNMAGASMVLQTTVPSILPTIVPTAHLPPSGRDPCAAFEAEMVGGPKRAITAEDLVSLGDIGRSDPHESPSPFGISPDEKQIAFQLRRANAAENDYCLRLMVAPLDAKGPPRELDRGGTFIRQDFQLREFVSILSGYAKVITPRWSPDGLKIGFLKQQGATHQLWLVGADGKAPAYRATSLPDNVDDFAWRSDGQAVVVATRPGIREQAEAIAREARSGFLFDDRFAPNKADRPIPTGPLIVDYLTVDLQSGQERAATADEIELLRPSRPVQTPEGAWGYTATATGTAAWQEPVHPRRLIGPSRPAMRLPDGQIRTCDDSRCVGVRQLWWSADGSILFTRQLNGWANSQATLLAWKSSEATPRETLRTDDVLVGCQIVGQELICAREALGRARRLVAIDPLSGQERLIYDPNPAFAGIALGAVRRFTFKNAYGAESWADLVLPPNHVEGKKHPLVVVQYHSQGFLRGGTADEFPIYLLAAKGFAVLSFARPFLESKAETEAELSAESHSDWRDRRSVQSSLEIAVRHAVATGAVDPNRMGISGFSDGTSTAQWALINSSLFKVAALGACCEDRFAYPLNAGPYFTQNSREMGYRFFEPDSDAFWKPMSLTLNVDSIDAPILVQTGDSEYEIGLDVAEIFRRREKAFELYVFEGEPHYKYQPAHRLAMYERSTEWFSFWLKKQIDCKPAKAAQYARWKAMKDAPRADELKCMR